MMRAGRFSRAVAASGWSSARIAAFTSVLTAGALLVDTASAGENVFSVPRRAPRETLLGANAADGPAPQPVFLSQTAPMTRPSLDDSGGLRIAGIDIGPGRGVIQMGPKVGFDRDATLKARWNDGRNATSDGLSLGDVSHVGWVVGAVGVGVGAYLLVTSDKKSGRETTVGTDFFARGAGLRVRRRF
jgi:hypothetical protein